MQTFAEGFLLTKVDMEYFRDHYLPDRSDWENPLASPLLARDLTGLAPALVVTAGFDPLRDDGVHYAEALRQAGVVVEERRYDDQIHGFMNMGIVPDSLAVATEWCESMGRRMRRSALGDGTGAEAPQRSAASPRSGSSAPGLTSTVGRWTDPRECWHWWAGASGGTAAPSTPSSSPPPDRTRYWSCPPPPPTSTPNGWWSRPASGSPLWAPRSRGSWSWRDRMPRMPARPPVMRAARLIYVAGSSPMHIRSVLKNSRVWSALVDAWHDGAVVARTSGAAMALTDPMVDARGGGLTIGLGLLTGLAVVPHFGDVHEDEHGEKLHRSVHLAPVGTPVAGIPERTALIRVPGGRWSSAGAGEVAVFLDGARAESGLGALPA